ncbi:LysM peptidoglycan-binding domain-containing protein [Paenibacillus sacheonensis]|uniref:LysM peptidoglycan-binding domain-containing protein n=1 Tax=Paenibacillus sacheonensis TaxID=742054 RepID=A0A7X5BX69_9BACL|nr:LysM peptidoglycan-binding domain-containing protein [Paenibacillus sacheonensis]MBM7563374.1 cell division protein YceG involved in septum cleavage [Paenibacillus sacheonensis]NBC68071.1 LysM peptidoglycan-binding domain-containing protein [Paenibacillus sacheonensis]
MMQTISSYSTAYKGNAAQVRKADRTRKDRSVERVLVRIAAASLLFVLLFAGLSLLTGHADGERPAGPSEAEQVITVGSGDTLWEIASSIRHEGDDIRRIVFDLQKRNNLDSSELKAGQTLIIPLSS